MPNPPLRDNEAATLEVLRQLEILDTAAEPEFDVLVEAASRICNMPMALISLVDQDRQWFKARVGLPHVSQTPRDIAFCAYAVLAREVFEIPDTHQDPRFADNPLVVGPPGIRFYAGAPLSIANGLSIGTLCIMDTLPRHLTAEERKFLSDLATAVGHLVEVRLAKRRSRAQRVFDAADAIEAAIDHLFEHTGEILLAPATGGGAADQGRPAAAAVHLCLTGSSVLLRTAHELLSPTRPMTPPQREEAWKQLAADTEIAGQAAARAARVLAAQRSDAKVRLSGG